VLLIGGAHDDKSPQDAVRGIYDSLPMPIGKKELWISAESGHGDAWSKEPAEYEARLESLLQRVCK